MNRSLSSLREYSTEVYRRDIIWRINAFLEGFVAGDRTWATLRLLVLLFVLFVVLVVGYIFETSVVLINSGEGVTYRVLTFPEFAIGPGLRYLFAPLGGLLLALTIGARYIQDIYDLKDFTLAFRYLLASIFAIGYPTLQISDGLKKVRPGEENLLDLIGGPGYISINPGNVVLFERLRGPSDVRAGGVHFVSRFETIKEIASLDDQEGVFEAIPAMTRDGIEVQVRDVKFRYRLITGHRSGSTARPTDNPYPFSVRAVRDMAYNRAVGPGGLSSWKSAVGLVVDGVISSYVNTHDFDQLISPRYIDGDPRREISQLMVSPATRAALKRVGAELLWFDIGYFDHTSEVQPHLSAWEARQAGDSEVILAEGEAQRLNLQEMGRAHAQAELLRSILRSMESANLTEDSAQGLRNLFLLRTAQVVESMTSNFHGEAAEEPEEQEDHERQD